MADKSDNEIQLVTEDFLLDDLEDLPAFVTFPTGAYHVHLAEGIVGKDVKMNDEETPCYEVAMTLVEVMEMQEELKEGETAPKPGDIASMLFNRKNKFGMGNYKEFARPIAERFGIRSIGEVNAASKGIDMLVVVKRTYNKDKDRYNMNFKKIAVI